MSNALSPPARLVECRMEAGAAGQGLNGKHNHRADSTNHKRDIDVFLSACQCRSHVAVAIAVAARGQEWGCAVCGTGGS